MFCVPLVTYKTGFIGADGREEELRQAIAVLGKLPGKQRDRRLAEQQMN